MASSLPVGRSYVWWCTWMWWGLVALSAVQAGPGDDRVAAGVQPRHGLSPRVGYRPLLHCHAGSRRRLLPSARQSLQPQVNPQLMSVKKYSATDKASTPVFITESSATGKPSTHVFQKLLLPTLLEVWLHRVISLFNDNRFYSNFYTMHFLKAPFQWTLRIRWTSCLRKRIRFLHAQLCGPSATFFMLSVFSWKWRWKFYDEILWNKHLTSIFTVKMEI